MDHQATLNEIDNLSMGELQRQLVTWIEEKGLLNELRAYLRKKMIFLLKDTILDQKTSVVDHIFVTPKLQALALLVAEYLVSQKLFYSLSVFNTEVPTITHVNKFCQLIQNTDEKTENLPKLDSEEISHILEAIGISLNSQLHNKIMVSYTSTTDRKESLIGSILENISSSVITLMERNVDKVTQGTNTDEALGGSKTINSITDMTVLLEEYHLKQYQSAILMFIEKEQARIKSEEKAKYKSKLFKHQKLLYQEVKTREEYVLKKLNEAEVRLVTQKQQIETNLKRKQSHLQELADELSHIHTQLTRREELLNSLKQEAICVLKDKSNTNVCDQCKSCDHLRKPEPFKASQEQTSLLKNTESLESDRLCERKLFSDIILSLQKENSVLKDQSLRHRTSIMKLKCKLAKKRSVHDRRPVCTSHLCLPGIKFTSSNCLSPIDSSDTQILKSSDSSVKSNISEEKASIVRITEETTNEVNNTEMQKKNSQKQRDQNTNNRDSIRAFVQDIAGENKYVEQKNETKSNEEKKKTSNINSIQQNNVKFECKNDNIMKKIEDKSDSLEKQVNNNLNSSDQQRINIKNSFQKIDCNEQTKSEIQQIVSVEIQESSNSFVNSNQVQREVAKDKMTNNKCSCNNKEVHKSSLLDKIKAGRLLQIPNVLIDVNTSDIYEGNFKDLAKKMKPLEDCVLYSKRIPNIYYAEPTCLETAPQGDVSVPCTKCSSSMINKEKLCKTAVRNDKLQNLCLNRNLSGTTSPVGKCSRNIKGKNSDVSVVSSNNSSSSARNKKYRKNSAQINNFNVEDMDENELFKKVCKSLGVPLTPVTSDSENRFTKSIKHVNIFSPNKSAKRTELSSEYGFDNTNTNLDNSAMSSLSDNSRDCETPSSLIIDSSLASS